MSKAKSRRGSTGDTSSPKVTLEEARDQVRKHLAGVDQRLFAGKPKPTLEDCKAGIKEVVSTIFSQRSH